MYSGLCDKGAVREVNQDSILMRSNGNIGLFAVADGMGGHSRGEFASQTIVENLDLWWSTFSEDSFSKNLGIMTTSLHQIIKKANLDIQKNIAPGEVCGSTVVVLFVYYDSYCLLTAGDSRMYSLEKRKIKQMTVDETWENQPDNMLSDSAKKKHPNYGKLINAIGISENLHISSKSDLLSKGYLFAICSDGIYKYGDEKFFKKSLKKASSVGIRTTISDIAKNVFERGAKDNMSLILVGDADFYHD